MKTKTRAEKPLPKNRPSKRVGSGTLVRRSVRKTKEQRQAARFLELAGIVHFLLTEQRCPVMFGGRLAYVRCPGVSKEAFKQAIDRKVMANLCAMIPRMPSPNDKMSRTAAGPAPQPNP